jgi:bifunctional DNase/RNase
MPIPCRFERLLLDEDAEHQVMVLAETAGPRHLSIHIGTVEAQAIDRAVRRSEFPRPLTHDLMSVMVTALQAELIEVRITDLDGGTFRAACFFKRHDGSVAEVDCRPSDAIALWTRCEPVPLLVTEAVLDEAGQEP